MKVVIIDNYDSFTYNLAHLVKELGADVTVFRIFKGKAKFLVSTLDGSSAAVLGASAVAWDM